MIYLVLYIATVCPETDGIISEIISQKRKAVWFNYRDRGDAIVWRREEEKAFSNSFVFGPGSPGCVKGQSRAAVRSRDPTAGSGAAKQTQGCLEPAQHSSPEGGCSLFCEIQHHHHLKNRLRPRVLNLRKQYTAYYKGKNGTSTAVQLSSFLLPARARLWFENFQNLKKKWHIWLCLLK